MNYEAEKCLCIWVIVYIDTPNTGENDECQFLLAKVTCKLLKL